MHVPKSHLWTILPHGRFRIRVLVALIEHQWFIRLRWILTALAALLLAVEEMVAAVPTRTWQLWGVVGALVPINLMWILVGRRVRRWQAKAGTGTDDALERATWFVNGQMSLDILVLTFMLRFSGGVDNPMAVFYLFHMLIAALLLKPLNALVQGGWALALFGGLAAGECLGWIAPHYPFLLITDPASAFTDPLYVIVSVSVLAAGVVGTLYFTLQISQRLDEQEHELAEVNKALLASKEAVERLQEKRSRFLQTSAHQLKTPLTGIEMLAALIRDGLVQGEGVNRIVTRIIQRCREAITQVTELLTLERVERSGGEHDSQSVTIVHKSLGRLISKFRSQLEAKGLALQTEIESAKELAAAVEPRDFEDCVGNLLENAIKYTPQGGRLWLLARSECGGWRIAVRDSGMGIAAGSVEEIFEPFYRGNQVLAANIPGSGLGLAIVREVVEQAGGKISVSSCEGLGSEFVLWLPGRPWQPNSLMEKPAEIASSA
jgi:signal transduction histidine kinase